MLALWASEILSPDEMLGVIVCVCMRERERECVCVCVEQMQVKEQMYLITTGIHTLMMEILTGKDQNSTDLR